MSGLHIRFHLLFICLYLICLPPPIPPATPPPPPLFFFQHRTFEIDTQPPRLPRLQITKTNHLLFIMWLPVSWRRNECFRVHHRSTFLDSLARSQTSSLMRYTRIPRNLERQWGNINRSHCFDRLGPRNSTKSEMWVSLVWFSQRLIHSGSTLSHISVQNVFSYPRPLRRGEEGGACYRSLMFRLSHRPISFTQTFPEVATVHPSKKPLR